ncbi:hypothetical protein TD95_003914 [Thielaviopsis punctulata]|uniref:FAM50A/XAP5 C-terminal domain-containing protein n=1 Tax=Thielaviopsis punctulata TaxID=72032 RepID=A0A0F4ZC40_9PEZI|nr:hypothetical protein TD95_003914 [Thielaviopsis punctulata]
MTSRFTPSNAAQSGAVDSLSTQTVGLVHLSEFRKRRTELIEAQESRAREALLGNAPAAADPSSQSDTPPTKPTKPKKRKAGKVKLSFSDDEGEEDASPVVAKKAKKAKKAVQPPVDVAPATADTTDSDAPKPDSKTTSDAATAAGKSKFSANTALLAPRIMTKSSQKHEAAERDRLRREFLLLQDAIKNTEIAIPFVFYDGTNIPGGVVRVRKGDYSWVFLDKSRKVGAALGVGDRANARKEWARVSIDDLILVRGTVIIPHHYDFYYFIMNKTLGPGGVPLFDFSTEAPTKPPAAVPGAAVQGAIPDGDAAGKTAATAFPEKTPADAPAPVAVPVVNPPLSTSASRAAARARALQMLPDIATLEGAQDDASFTKVVNRRWYERNKHIYPASTWQEFDAEKDYTTDIKRDTNGNAFFFS